MRHNLLCGRSSTRLDGGGLLRLLIKFSNALFPPTIIEFDLLTGTTTRRALNFMLIITRRTRDDLTIHNKRESLTQHTSGDAGTITIRANTALNTTLRSGA